MIEKSTQKPRLSVPNFKSLSKSRSRPISKYLPANNAATNLSTVSISTSSLLTAATGNLLTAASSNLSAIAPNNLSVSTINSNTTPKLSYDDIKKPKTQNCSKLEIGNGCSSTDLQLLLPKLRTLFSEFRYSLLVTPENATPNNQELKQTPTSNILPATIMENKSLDTIFPFELKELSTMPLFSEAALEEKPITAMYTDVKIDGHPIKLILDSSCQVDRTASARIITADRVTKTPISEINDLPIEINGIIIPIKVLIIEATQYQALVVPATCGHFKTTNTMAPLIDFEEEKPKPTWEHNKLPPILSWDNNGKGKQTNKLTWKTNNLTWTDNKQKEKRKKKCHQPPPFVILTPTTLHNNLIINDQGLYTLIAARNCCQWAHAVVMMRNTTPQQSSTVVHAYSNVLDDQRGKENRITNLTLLDEGMWNDILKHRGTCNVSCQYTILISNWVRKETPIEAAWRRAVQMAITKIEEATPKKIRKIKNNPSEPIELDWDPEPVINLLDSEQFHKHYQELALTREKQKQHLEEINTRLCDHCLIPCDFQYCNECDLIYNLSPHMIYMIPKEEEPINSCVLESELVYNPDSNSDNDNNKNTDLSKKQELKWYSDNGKGIMPKRAHNTDAGFDLRYPGKDVIKLKPHLCTCIDLKIVLEISATTIVQLASQSSLAKRRINIKGGIIDMRYVGNIITMLQNDSNKAYIIEPNEKIAQAIFLPLVKIAQLVLVRNREELGITARRIQGFGLMSRIDILVNMAKEEIVGQGEIISTSQAISIPPYSQYMLAIERKEKEQEQIFEAEANLCELGEIGLINFHIPAKSYSHIKILIYNNTDNVINIPEGTTIGYLTTKIEDQLPNPIPDFSQLCGYVDITSQTIYR
ncbi:hypothetical protein G9A89_016501 [Geosiphon pyriformis]|nr:hypothetical protein G9A89_016501 [Geosiphon pyriformis]